MITQRDLAMQQAQPKRRALTIGLVNNMGDEALKVTERQFTALIGTVKGDIDVRVRPLVFKRTPRSPRALDYIAGRYEPVSSAMDDGLDGLIVTGAQPVASRLDEEPYWEELVELIEWAKDNTASTILSCLAAHAGVFHLDGVSRQRLPDKCTGVFPFSVQRDHRLCGERGQVRRIPHSRYYGVLQSDLERAGYDVLTGSPAHGVDSFTKDLGSQFVFLQGHPEYDANSLAREYRRDVARRLRQETDRGATRPKNYFHAEAEAELNALELKASKDPVCLTEEDLSKIDALAPETPQWRDAAIAFYRNWIQMIAASTEYGPAATVLTGHPELVPAVA
jgi:homoserine O-succinyltransferase/O-acetyltransferase